MFAEHLLRLVWFAERLRTPLRCSLVATLVAL
jgi:hypothetical protein